MKGSDIKVDDLETIKMNLSNELTKIGLEWEGRVYQDALIEGLDSLLVSNKSVSSSKFNRLLFSHILEFGSIDPEKPIQISDFINAYFLVYDSMIHNKQSFSNKCSYLNETILKIKNDIDGIKAKESQEPGKSTYYMRFELKKIEVFENLDETNPDVVYKGGCIMVESVNELETNEKASIELSLNSLNSRPGIEFQQNSLKDKLNIYYINKIKGEKVLLDSVIPLNCIDFYVERMYEIQDKGNVLLDFILISSKFDFWTRKINEYEANFHDAHIVYDNLSSSINLLEEPFKNYFQSHNRQSSIDYNEYGPSSNETANKPVALHKTFEKKEVEVSEKIENMIHEVSGKKVIVWEKIYYFLNKIMVFSLIFSFINRADFASFILGSLGIGIETRSLSHRHFQLITLFLLLTFIFDFFWLLFSFADWSQVSPYEGSYLALRRRISIVASFIVFLTKIVLVFSGWRCSIINKLKVSNPLFKKTSLSMAAKARMVPVKYSAEPEEEKKKKRPVISYENSKELNLRFTDSIL